MDAKYLAEITARDSAELPETAAPVFRDRHALIAEVEDSHHACEIACASAREYCDKLVIAEKQISTLKKALELACEDQTEHCPYTLHGGKRVCSKYPMYGLRCQDCAPKYYIQQAQEQEGKK